MESTDRVPGGIKTADKVFDILEIIRQKGPISLTALADHLDIASSTAHGYVKSLEFHEYIVRNDDNEYKISLKFLDFGEELREDLPIVSVAKEPLEQLAEETGEVAWIYVEEHGYAVPVSVEQGDRAVQIVGRIGNRKHMHLISAGKAMLAEMPEQRTNKIIKRHGLPSSTDNTITDREALRTELSEIRELGYAYNDGEEVEGIRAVGMAVETNGRIQGAISVSGPTNRIGDDRFHHDLPEAVSGTVNEIELKLTYNR